MGARGTEQNWEECQGQWCRASVAVMRSEHQQPLKDLEWESSFHLLPDALEKSKWHGWARTGVVAIETRFVLSLSRVWLFGTPWTAARQASLSFTISGACSNSCRLSQWCHPTLSSSVTHFSSSPQSFSASVSFPVNQLFASGGQSIRTSASASVIPMNIQGLFPLGLTGLMSLLSKELLRVYSSTTVQKHQFFGTQPSFWSNSHICTWLQEKP